MFEHHLARLRTERRNPVGQVRCRIEPCDLRDALEVQHRPKLRAPQPQQGQALRGLAASDAFLVEILGLQIGAGIAVYGLLLQILGAASWREAVNALKRAA